MLPVVVCRLSSEEAVVVGVVVWRVLVIVVVMLTAEISLKHFCYVTCSIISNVHYYYYAHIFSILANNTSRRAMDGFARRRPSRWSEFFDKAIVAKIKYHAFK